MDPRRERVPPENSLEADALAFLHDIRVPRLGAYHEAAMFARLLARPDIVRAFEFAAADGAIDCSAGEARQDMNAAERFFDLAEQVGEDPHLEARLLIPFDVKSRLDLRAEGQIYITTVRQRERVAFFLGICAANPGFVDLIPNRLAGVRGGENRYTAVNASRKSLLPPPLYRYLSPCNAAYRMPLAFLSSALDSVRSCAAGGGDYVNPWTQARFRGWEPFCVRSHETLTPDEITQGAHVTAYEGTERIQRAIRSAGRMGETSMRFDFMHHQPEIADFKLITAGPAGDSAQWFVQYKIDGQGRAPGAALTDVSIARASPLGLRHYFTPLQRFHFLLYEFCFAIREGAEVVAWDRWLFFLPERVLPDLFYTSEEASADFTGAGFRDYWIHMDAGGAWVGRVEAIIGANPHPRRVGQRPARAAAPGDEEEEDGEPALPRALESRELDWFHGRFFGAIMGRCAHRMSGLLAVIAADHDVGDLVYCRHYRWTWEERDAYFARGWPPHTISTLPAGMSLLPLFVFAKRRVGTARGPSLTAAEARRLCASPALALLCFDSFGMVGRGTRCPLVVVPSDDISHTAEQRATYEEVLSTRMRHTFSPRVPRLAEQLHTACCVDDYRVASDGPMIFEGGDPWDEALDLLDSFGGVADFPFPRAQGIVRVPGRYQVCVRDIHQWTVDRDAQ